MHPLSKSNARHAASGNNHSLRLAAAISFLTLALMLSACGKGAGGNSMSLKWPGMAQKDIHGHQQ
jgi:hypothetical protein